MSLAIRAARGNANRGDPGLFDFLGKAARAVTGVVGGLGIPVISGAARGLGSLLPGTTQVPIKAAGQGLPGTGIGVAVGFPRIGGFGGGGFQVGTGITSPFTQQVMNGPNGEQVMVDRNGKVCSLKGTHLNKSNYYRHRNRIFGVDAELVKAGTICVKNRRMNPLNPRALSRSMRRIVSAKRATKFLSRITVRSACPGRKSCG